MSNETGALAVSPSSAASTQRPRISVALCTHNGQAYLEEQLLSILAQTRPADEIVLGDDASTDGTVDLARKVLAGSGIDLILRLHDPALGVRENFADAISATTGDIVILCDQDDVWHPDKVEVLVAALEAEGPGVVDLVHSDARLVDAHGDPLGSNLLEELRTSTWERENLQSGDALAVLLRRNIVTGATLAVRGDFARAAMPVPKGWIHDEWLAMIAAVGGTLRLCPQVLTDYRQHGRNQIGAKKEPLFARVRRMSAPDPVDDRRRLDRATSAAAVAAERGLGTPAQRKRLEEAARHQRARSALPRNRILRLGPILAEVLAGRYHRCSRGWLTVGRDIVQVRH